MDNKTAAERLYGPDPADKPAGSTLLSGGHPVAQAKPAKPVASRSFGEVMYDTTSPVAPVRR